MQLTENQRRVLKTLRVAKRPLTAYALLDALRNEGFSAPTQIYRALEPLVRNDLVHRLESVKGYVACSCPDECPHAHSAFAICDTCGVHEEFFSQDIADIIARGMEQLDFATRTTTIEIRGKCASCAKRAQSADR